MKGPGGIPVWALLKLAESDAQPACKGHKAAGFPSSLVNSWNVFLRLEGSVRQLERECVRFDVLCADDSQHTRANEAWVFFYFLPDCSLQKELTGEKYLSIGSVMIAQPIHLIRVCVHVVVRIHVLSAYHFCNCTGRIRGLEAECSSPHLVEPCPDWSREWRPLKHRRGAVSAGMVPVSPEPQSRPGQAAAAKRQY